MRVDSTVGTCVTLFYRWNHTDNTVGWWVIIIIMWGPVGGGQIGYPVGGLVDAGLIMVVMADVVRVRLGVINGVPTSAAPAIMGVFRWGRGRGRGWLVVDGFMMVIFMVT